MTIRLVAARGVAPYPGTLHFPGIEVQPPEPASGDECCRPSLAARSGRPHPIAGGFRPPSDIGIVWVGRLNSLAQVNDKYV